MKQKIRKVAILSILFLPALMYAQSRAVPAELSAWISSTPFTWSDNENTLGTITFSADGQGKATWSGDTHFWKVESNGDLMVSAMGTQYVTRFVYDATAGSFAGARDKSSQVQDGVRTMLKPKVSLDSFQPKAGMNIIDRLKAWLAGSRFTWADNGNDLGMIAFALDGAGKASWSGETHYWKVEPNGDLVVSAMGTQYVTRFIYDFSTGGFNGRRDAASQVQDGVRATLKAIR